jgi:hypothetical protein
MPTRPNCCCSPLLRTIRVVDEAAWVDVILEQCDTCQTYWLAAHGRLELADGNDLEIDSIERLSGADVEELLLEYA